MSFVCLAYRFFGGLLALLPVLAAGPAAVAHHQTGDEQVRLVVAQHEPVGRADVTVVPSGEGRGVTGTVTRTTGEAGCLTLAAVPADPEPWTDPLAGGEVLGVHCGPGTVPVAGHTRHGVLVLVWDADDGLPAAWTSAPLRDGIGA